MKSRSDVVDLAEQRRHREQKLVQARKLLMMGAISPDDFALVKDFYTPGRAARQAWRMGSLKRKTKKRVAKHLRLVKPEEPKPTGLLDPANGFITPDAFSKVVENFSVVPPAPERCCSDAREDYELDAVTCCVRCHKKGEFSEVEDNHGRINVCCTIRQALCPGEEAPAHT
jgi:hypothetical protein